MKFFTKSSGVNLSEVASGTSSVVAPGTGVSVSSTIVGTVVTYTVSSDVDLSDVEDINITSVANKDTLLYNSGTSQWENGDFTLDNLSNVNITTPADKVVLLYDNATSKWIDGKTSLTNLSDATITTPASGEILKYNGSIWINGTLAIDAMSDVVITNPQANQVLAYVGGSWVNTNMSTITGGMLEVNATDNSNSSAAQEYLQTYKLDSTYAVNEYVFEIEARFTLVHTTDNTEVVAIKLDNSITLASVTVESGDNYTIILKAKLTALTGDIAHFSEETKLISGRALEPVQTAYFGTTSFTLNADHTFKVWVDPGRLGSAGKITCNYFDVKYTK